MSEKVRHPGIIDTISEECVKVRILQTSACAHCKISGHCNSSDSKEKIVDVYNVPDKSELSIGDEVIVTASVGMAAKALLLGFGVPLVILIAVLLAIYMLTSDEAISALGSVAALAPYYAVLYLYREKLRDRMAFEIERKNKV